MSFPPELIRDVRHGLRLVRRNPGVATTATVVIALGVGTAFYGFASHSIFSRGLDVRDTGRMVIISSTIPEEGDWQAGLSFDDHRDFAAVQTTVDGVALWDAYVPVNLVTGDTPPERITITETTSLLHRLLRFTPRAGRMFVEGDDHREAPLVAVLTHGFWQRRFGGNVEVVGRTVEVDRRPVTIVGVLSEKQGFTGEDLFLSLRAGPDTAARRGQRDYLGLGRLRTGVSIRDADAEFQMLANRLSENFPATNDGVSASVVTFVDGFFGSANAGRRLFNITTVLIFLVAILNVANLFLSRALARDHEMRVRIALGASRWRTVSHFMGEAAIPVVLGSGIGAFVANGLLRSNEANTEAWLRYQFEWPHAAFIGVATLLALGLIGTVAAMRLIGRNRTISIMAGGRWSTDRSVVRLGSKLVVGQIALGGTALFVAGLMVKTAVNLAAVDYGFAIDDVVTGTVQLDETRYPTATSREVFWNAFQARAQAIPGVTSVSLATQLPMIRYRGWTQFKLGNEAEDVELRGTYRNAITPEFFETFGVALMQGRAFTRADNAAAEPVVIVNEDFVRKFFPDGRPLGRMVRLGGRGTQEPWRRVIGVATHMWMDSDEDANPEGVYVPFTQHDQRWASIALRVSGAPTAYRDVLREALMTVDASLPMDDVMTMGEVIHERTALYRRVRGRYLYLGLVALALSMVGLYSVMAQSVRLRNKELGIRMAVGASAGDIGRMIFRQGIAQVAAGVIGGVGAALYTAKGISRMVFQMSPWDPWVLVASFAVLTLTGVLAILIPGRRAARVNPMAVLD